MNSTSMPVNDPPSGGEDMQQSNSSDNVVEKLDKNPTQNQTSNRENKDASDTNIPFARVETSTTQKPSDNIETSLSDDSIEEPPVAIPDTIGKPQFDRANINNTPQSSVLEPKLSPTNPLPNNKASQVPQTPELDTLSTIPQSLENNPQPTVDTTNTKTPSPIVNNPMLADNQTNSVDTVTPPIDKSKNLNVTKNAATEALVTPNTSSHDSKFNLFISILIGVVILVWVGVGFLYFSNKQLNTTATASTVQTSQLTAP